MNRSATNICNETFLESRAKLLEVAANLDRIDRASVDGALLTADGDKQRERINAAIRILLSEEPDRAERLQHLFSREYEPDWRKQMNV